MQLQDAISTLRDGIDTILNCNVPYEQMDAALKLVEEKLTPNSQELVEAASEPSLWLHIDDMVDCKICSDKDKVASIRLILDEMAIKVASPNNTSRPKLPKYSAVEMEFDRWQHEHNPNDETLSEKNLKQFYNIIVGNVGR